MSLMHVYQGNATSDRGLSFAGQLQLLPGSHSLTLDQTVAAASAA